MMPPADAAPPHAGAEVICAGVVHVYPGEAEPIVALRNVDLHVRAGEMLALVGPSGSGKSTLLALLSGLLAPTGGRILIAGHDMTRLDGRGLSRLRATELALLLQDPLHNLLPYATVRENLAFAQRGARRRDWPLRWGPDDLVAAFGLGSTASRPVHRLSGGEQQKVALASAMATSPRVLLADEPTGALDPAGKDAVIAALRQAHDLSQATIIIVTHDSGIAESLPRALAIAHGVIGGEGRGGRRFAVLGRDSSVQLPPEVAARYAAGTIFTVTVSDDAVQLRPEPSLEDGAHAPRPDRESGPEVGG